MLPKICKYGLKSKVTAVLGCQWGDEGKGKLVDILAQDHDIVARFNGGSNAGHTLKIGDKKFVFHLLPCGLLYEDKTNVIGNGVVINVQELFEELKQLDEANISYAGNLFVSDRAQLTFQAQREIDGYYEKTQRLGTTMKGIGPTYAYKCMRSGLRVGELRNWDRFVQKYLSFNAHICELYNLQIDTSSELESIKQCRDRMLDAGMITDTVHLVNDGLAAGQRVLVEGANALMLDLDFGTYPYVTSSNTSVGAISTGLGLPPRDLECNIGVVKAYTTRVGEGPFLAEQLNEVGETLQQVGCEFGSTTGRPRRCGWLDLSVVGYAHRINGLSSINLTKLDVMSSFPEIDVITHYEKKGTGERVMGTPAQIEDQEDLRPVSVTLPGWESDITGVETFEDLPLRAREYVQFIEECTSVPVSWIGVGPDRKSMFQRPGLEQSGVSEAAGAFQSQILLEQWTCIHI